MENRFFRSPFYLFLLGIALSCTKGEKKVDDTSAAIMKSANAQYQAIAHKPVESTAFLSRYKQESAQRRDTLNLANADYQLGKHYLALNRPDSAFYHFNQSKQQYELLRDSLQVAEKLILMADIYYRNNDFFGVEGASHEALGFLGRIDTAYDTIYAGIVYNNYGLASIGMKDYPTAIRMFKKALACNADPVGRKLMANNMAWAYMEQGNFSKAIDILKPLAGQTVDLAEANAKVLDNLGYSMFRSGRDGAESLLHRSRVIRESENNYFGLVPVYIHLSEFYRANPPLAMEYAVKAYRSATLAQSPDDRLHALQNLRSLSNGTLRERYSEQWIALKDSLETARMASKYQFARIRFDSRRATEENLRLRAAQADARLQIKQREYQNLALALAVGALVVISVLIFLKIRRRHKEEKSAGIRQTEERISKRLHDELANDVFNAMAFAESHDLADPDAREVLLSSLDSVYSRTRDISREHATVGLGEEYPDHLRSMLFGFSKGNMNVLVQGLDGVPWGRVGTETKTALWRILQELMVNNRKHSGATLTAIRFGVERDRLAIRYQDNGCGMDTGADNRRHGLRNVENRIGTIGGTIIFESEPNKGLHASLSIPL